MKYINLILFFFTILNSGKINSQSWVQVGSDIDGEAAADLFGRSLASSNNGSIIAIGAPNNDGGGNVSGSVKVYQYSSGSWTQMGSDIDGEAVSNQVGYSVALSEDGLTLATRYNSSAPYVRILRWNGTNWYEIGKVLDKDAYYGPVSSSRQYGNSLALSSDGNRIAIGCPGCGDTSNGSVVTYDYIDGVWNMLDNYIRGSNKSDLFGESLSFSSDGNTLAVGATGSDPVGDRSGQVRIFDYDKTSGELGFFYGGGDNLHRTRNLVQWERLSNSRVFTDVSVPNNWIVYAVNSEGVWKSGNEGTGWSRIYTSSNISEISFPTSEIGYIIKLSHLYKTTDGGVTWDLLNESINFNDIDFPSHNVGYANNGNVLYKTVDGGVTWDVIMSNSSRLVSGISFSSNDIGYGIKDGQLWRTSDGGAYWEKKNQNRKFISVSAIDDGRGYVFDEMGNFGRFTGHGTNIIWENRGIPSGRKLVFPKSNQWTEVGKINGDSSNDWKGWSISLSSSGDTIAVGSPYSDPESRANAGKVDIYYRTSSNTWPSLGSTLLGKNTKENFGWSVSLSGDGTRVAVGAPYPTESFTTLTEDVNPGLVRVFEFSTNSNSWIQLGEDIDGVGTCTSTLCGGSSPGDRFGYSVSLSNDGKVLFAGAIQDDNDSGTNAGHVRAFRFDYEDGKDTDSDGDGILDSEDNCPLIANTNQLDTDGDGTGDVCDTDDDGDGILDSEDNCPLIANTNQLDTDGDGTGDVCDTDDDGDGILDIEDNCPLISNIDQLDLDGNNIGNLCDDGYVPSFTWEIEKERLNEKDDSLLLTVSIDKALDKDVSVVLDFSGSATKNIDYGGAFIDRYQTNKFLTFGSRLTVDEGNTYRNSFLIPSTDVFTSEGIQGIMGFEFDNSGNAYVVSNYRENAYFYRLFKDDENVLSFLNNNNISFGNKSRTQPDELTIYGNNIYYIQRSGSSRELWTFNKNSIPNSNTSNLNPIGYSFFASGGNGWPLSQIDIDDNGNLYAITTNLSESNDKLHIAKRPLSSLTTSGRNGFYGYIVVNDLKSTYNLGDSRISDMKLSDNFMFISYFWVGDAENSFNKILKINLSDYNDFEIIDVPEFGYNSFNTLKNDWTISYKYNSLSIIDDERFVLSSGSIGKLYYYDGSEFVDISNKVSDTFERPIAIQYNDGYVYLIDESQDLKQCDNYSNASLCYSDFYFYRIKLDNLLKIPAGNTSAGFYLKSIDDVSIEGDESVDIKVLSVSNSNIDSDSTKSFKIIDDDDPTITITLSDSTIYENKSVNSNIGKINVEISDPSFNLVSSEILNTYDYNYFDIDGDQLVSQKVFDYEDKNSYRIEIKSKVQGVVMLEKTQTFNINVLNESEILDLTISKSSVDENKPLGSVVGNFITTDEDTTENHVYELVNGAGDTDNDLFIVDGNTLKTNYIFDYENIKKTYNIRVRSTNSDNFSYEKFFLITIDNIPDVILSLDISNYSVKENQPLETLIGLLSSLDDDSAASHTYTLVSGEGDDDNSSFSIYSNFYVKPESTVAGGNESGSSSTKLNEPEAIIFDKSGNLYISDQNNHRIQKWIPGSLEGITVAGGNGAGSGANQLQSPRGITLDESGNLYIADANNHRIQKWAPGAITGTTVAGGNGVGFAANQLNNPNDIALDSSGNLYIADVTNHRIQKWASGASQGSTVLGGFGQGSAANQLHSPRGITLDEFGNLYIADTYNHRIQKWENGSSEGVTVAGGNGPGYNVNQLNNPRKIILDIFGNMYIADASNNRIQRWLNGASEGVTVAGGNGLGPDADQVNFPTGLAFDEIGNLYVADHSYHRIQKWISLDNNGLLVSSEVFDFERRSTYSIRVQSVSSNGYSYEKVISIQIEDLPDQIEDILISDSLVDENRVGKIVTLSAIDQEPSATHTFELTEGDGDEDNNQFNIGGNVLSLPNFNYETKNKLKIRVKAVSSNGGYSYEKSFTILVIDQPDDILDISLDNNSILENKSIGSLVGKILITDEYEVCENCQPKSYQVMLYAPEIGGKEDNPFFKIRLGQVFDSINYLESNEIFDYETKTKYTIDITVLNNSTGSMFQKEFEINILDDVSDNCNPSLTFNGTVNTGASPFFNTTDSLNPDQADYKIIALPFQQGSLHGLVSNMRFDQFKLMRWSYDNSTGSYGYKSKCIEDPACENGFCCEVTNVGEGLMFLSTKIPNNLSEIQGELYGYHNECLPYLSVNLSSGWTMMGNPYLQTLNWSKIEVDNGFTGGGFMVYNGGWNMQSTLSQLRGAFINSDDVSTSKIVINNPKFNSSGKEFTGKKYNQIEGEEWLLNIELKGGGIHHKISQLGQRRDASNKKDRYDLSMPPSLEKPFDIRFAMNTSRDIRRTGSQDIEWTFEIENEYSAKSMLRWSFNSSPGNEIYLLDTQTGDITNMLSENMYAFNGKGDRKFKVLRGSNTFISEKIGSLIGEYRLYPNPTKENLYLESYKKIFIDEIKIYSVDGKEVEPSMKQTIRDNGLSQIIEIGLQGIKSGAYIVFVNGNHRFFVKE